MSVTALHEIEVFKRADYFTDRLIQLFRIGKEIEFDYVAIGGLMELCRQYTTMPGTVRELAGNDLKETIANWIQKNAKLVSVRDSIPIKELKSSIQSMLLVKELRSEKYINALFESLSDPITFKGLIKAVRYVVRRGLPHGSENESFELLDDLILLIIEYLSYRGHTQSEIITQLPTRPSATDSMVLLDEVLSHLSAIGAVEIQRLPAVPCQLTIRCLAKNKESWLRYARKYLELLAEEHRVAILDESTALNSDQADIRINFDVYKVDGRYVERILGSVNSQLLNYRERTGYVTSEVYIRKDRLDETSLYVPPGATQRVSQWRIKYFDMFWRKSDFGSLDRFTYDEISRLHEWVDMVGRAQDKQLSFNALWSIMEFMLIDSATDNKIDTICNRFTPYMGLFYFRKVLKTFFKKLIDLRGSNWDESANILIDWVKQQLAQFIQIEDHSVADLFCIFLFHRNLKSKWWNGLEFEHASRAFIQTQTEKISTSLSAPLKSLDQFENLIKVDLRQMYRLRNMMTHGGINDDKVLDNTYDRLKYYVETLLNATSYVWLSSQGDSNSFSEIADRKRVDYRLYKEAAKNTAQVANNIDIFHVLSLVNYQGLTSTPPNRFSFLGSLELTTIDSQDKMK